MNQWQSPARGCAESRRIDSRRGFIKAGVLGSGLTLSQLLAHEGLVHQALADSKNAPPQALAKKGNSVIILWMRGGPSHIDMWDPKPDAPAEFRGEFGT